MSNWIIISLLIIIVFFPSLASFVLLSKVIYGQWLYFADSSLVSIAVLFATLIVIMVYTWKAWQLKDLTSKQITFKIRPFVIFEPPYYKLINVGNGIAFEVKIEKISIDNCGFSVLEQMKEEEREKYKGSYIVFKTVNMLVKDKPEQGSAPRMLDKDGNEVELGNQICNKIDTINSNCSLKNFNMIITYKDIEKKEYKTFMGIVNNRLQVIDFK